jgi:hypothetical protein
MRNTEDFMGWFYEYDGKEHGPVPRETLVHLATHGAINRASALRCETGHATMPAGQVAFLEPHFANNASVAEKVDSGSLVRSLLSNALDTIRNGVEVTPNEPLTDVVHQSRCLVGLNKAMLLAYQIETVESLPIESVKRSPSAKSISQCFKAVVQARVCKPLSWTDSIDQLKKHAPEQRSIVIIYHCYQLQAGRWILEELAGNPLQ